MLPKKKKVNITIYNPSNLLDTLQYNIQKYLIQLFVYGFQK